MVFFEDDLIEIVQEVRPVFCAARSGGKKGMKGDDPGMI